MCVHVRLSLTIAQFPQRREVIPFDPWVKQANRNVCMYVCLLPKPSFLWEERSYFLTHESKWENRNVHTYVCLSPQPSFPREERSYLLTHDSKQANRNVCACTSVSHHSPVSSEKRGHTFWPMSQTSKQKCVHVCLSLTTAQFPQRREVILFDPWIACFQQQAQWGWCQVDMIQLQPFHHLPVTSCE